MPTTYNGIGTHYYGKRNVQTRPGTCPHCHRTVNLISYDTRLWFVVLFIPVIPIGRKRIIDRCPSCSRHYVMDAQKWETAKQLETSGALEKFRSNPTPEAAIEAHRQFLNFQQIAEAAELQKTMCEKFADNARVQAYLAAALNHLGKVSEAEPFFARALELRPDLPEARIGVACTHIRAQRLDEARRLLDFLEKPGAAQLYALSPLEDLANAYQKAARHTEALALFGRLLEELPAAAQHKGFRKRVQQSEAALHCRTSILPKSKFSLRRWLQFQPSAGPARSVSPRTLLLVLGGAAVVITLVLMLANENIRRHRKLYVANGLGPNLRVEISGIGPVKLSGGITEVTLPEGHYQARISGPIQDEVSIDMHAGYFGRWFDKPVWILNPGGAAILIVERAVYSKNSQPSSVSYVYGQAFLCLPDITHPFTPLPQTVSVESGTDQKVLTGLELFRSPPLHAFYALDHERRHDEASNLAEWHLRRNPEDKEMLLAYANSSDLANELPRIEAFLRNGLTNRPVRIEWHRTYQDLQPGRRGSAQLLGVYDDLLKADPNNSALLYLRGRICGDHALAADLFALAHKADELNPYPIYAMGFDKAAVGNWEAAKLLLDRAVELRPDDPQFRVEWAVACVALGQFDQPEKEYQAKLQLKPTDWQSALHLCDVLVAAGKRKEAEQTIADLVRATRARFPASAEQVQRVVQNHYLYAVGDFAGLEKANRLDKSLTGKVHLFCALLEQNRLEEATTIYSAEKVKEPLFLLALSLTSHLAGKPGEAQQWQAPLLQAFHSSGADGLRAADLLEGKVEPTQSALDAIVLSPTLKAALLADLAATHPDRRKELNAAARQLNVDRSFPYHLIQRATAMTP
jgi:tetratricopeptide (TPR) repeat protein